MMLLTALFALIAATCLFAYDKRERTHKPVACLLAWLYFTLFVAIMLAALSHSQALLLWLLGGLVGLNALSLCCQLGNVTQLFARRPSVLTFGHKPTKGRRPHADHWF